MNLVCIDSLLSSGVAIEAVLDSSRYFVVRIQNDAGQSANVGIGFADRGDSFDLNVALQDYFKGRISASQDMCGLFLRLTV